MLLGARSGKPRDTMQTTIDELLALQRADGGWSQTVPELKSDAFATGQTLYVLSLAGYTAERPEIKRGIDFLVATQKPDGSWPMISRSTPDGSPGSAKLLTPITCAASSWATLGLARLAPKGPDWEGAHEWPLYEGPSPTKPQQIFSPSRPSTATSAGCESSLVGFSDASWVCGFLSDCMAVKRIGPRAVNKRCRDPNTERGSEFTTASTRPATFQGRAICSVRRFL